MSDGLIEREGELARLEEAYAQAAEGEGAFIVVEGAAGIGKSRLLEAARDAATDNGLATLTARGGELERDYAYGLVRQLFERMLHDLEPARREQLMSGAAELAAPALGMGTEAPPASGDASFAAVHGLYWLVSNLSAGTPLVLLVDDLHWGDAPSLRFIHYLVPRLEGLPVLVLAATRPAEPGADPLVARAMAEPAANRLRPGPLSVDGVARLVAERFGEGADLTFAAACHSATGGNPFLLSELLEALIRDGVAPDVEGTRRVLELGPETVSRSLFLRLARLPADSGRLAQAVAVLGSAPELRDAAALAGLELEQAAAAADALAAIHILDPKELGFIHPVVRQAVYSELPPAERATLHSRAAEVLREAGAPAQELAAHLLAAPAAGSQAAVETLRLAAKGALEQGAADLACRYLQRAMAEPPPEEGRASLLAELGWAEWLAFEDPMGAIAHLQEAYEGTTGPAERANRLMLLARATFSTGNVAGAYDHLEGGVDELAGKVDEHTLLRLEAETASVGLVVPPTLPRATERLERFVGIEGASPAELLQIANLAAWKWIDGTTEEAGELAERALADGKVLEAEGSDSIMIYEAIWVLIWADRHELAADALRQTYAAARSSGSVFGLCTSLAVRSILYWRRGDLARSEADARNALDFPGVPAFVWPPLHIYLALVLIERGELEEADRMLELAGVGPGLPELVHFNAGFYARGQLRLHQGRIEEALEDFRELGARDERLTVRNPSIPWRCGAAEALVRLGRGDEAVALADEHRELADAWGATSGIGVAMWAQGLARGGEGLDLLAEATEVLADAPARLDHAYALVDLGAATRRAGRRAEAREPLREGLEAARRCGATALVELAHEELIAAGAKPRRLQFSGLESLTASERRVSQLAARGLTNREIAQELFVTQKTVENHLTRVYAKLDIDSRDRLAGALAGSE